MLYHSFIDYSFLRFFSTCLPIHMSAVSYVLLPFTPSSLIRKMNNFEYANSASQTTPTSVWPFPQRFCFLEVVLSYRTCLIVGILIKPMRVLMVRPGILTVGIVDISRTASLSLDFGSNCLLPACLG